MLVADPAVLILDEPTVGMDVEARRGFWASVRGFAARGKTVMFATHYLEEADAYAHRVILVSHGRVVADGPTSEVRARVGRLFSCLAAARTRPLAHCERPRAARTANRARTRGTDKPANTRRSRHGANSRARPCFAALVNRTHDPRHLAARGRVAVTFPRRVLSMQIDTETASDPFLTTGADNDH